MTPKLYKAAEVCEMAQLQPYVLRSWEKEFPGIGLQKTPEGPRFYRQSDVDQVLRIKQLVFGEGLTLAGARRRLEELAPQTDTADADLVFETLSSGAQAKVASVKQGLRSLLDLLDHGPRAEAVEYQLQAPVPRPEPVAVGKKSRRASA